MQRVRRHFFPVCCLIGKWSEKTGKSSKEKQLLLRAVFFFFSLNNLGKFTEVSGEKR